MSRASGGQGISNLKVSAIVQINQDKVEIETGSIVHEAFASCLLDMFLCCKFGTRKIHLVLVKGSLGPSLGLFNFEEGVLNQLRDDFNTIIRALS